MDLRTPALPRVMPSKLLDACVALVLALAGGLSGLNVRALGGHDPWVAVAVLIAMGLVLYPRRRYPEAVLTAEAAGVGVLVALGVKLDASFLSVLVSSYSAAVYGSRRTARVLLVAVVAIVVAVRIPVSFGAGNGMRAVLPVPTLIAAAGACGVGLVIRRQFALRDTAVRALAERATLVAAQQEEHTQRATLAERLRIARELHDIVAHHMSVIAIQAEAGPRKVAHPPPELVESFADIRASALSGLDELRRLLGVMRSSGADTAPQPGLAELDDLLDSARSGGVRVTSSVSGTARALPQGIDLSAYRIVQEALSNVMRHAPGSAARVELGYAPSALVIKVRNDACAAPDGDADQEGAGHGLIGMRERAGMLGGHLEAGPTDDGGFLVTAVLPDTGDREGSGR